MKSTLAKMQFNLGYEWVFAQHRKLWDVISCPCHKNMCWGWQTILLSYCHITGFALFSPVAFFVNHLNKTLNLQHGHAKTWHMICGLWLPTHTLVHFKQHRDLPQPPLKLSNGWRNTSRLFWDEITHPFCNCIGGVAKHLLISQHQRMIISHIL